jgi:DNA-binding NarL/FixJ family response regulator
MASTVRVLIAVMRRSVRQGVRLLLGAQSDLEVAGEAEDRAGALTLARKLHPAVVVVDLILPGLEYVEFLRQVHLASPRTRVVVLKTPADGSGLTEAPVAHGLIRAVRDAAARRKPAHIPLPAAVVDVRDPKSQALGKASNEDLTPREQEVVLMAAAGLSSTETARRMGISPRTVESHRTRAMRKLGLHRRAELVRYAVVRGMLPPDRGGSGDT